MKDYIEPHSILGHYTIHLIVVMEQNDYVQVKDLPIYNCLLFCQSRNLCHHNPFHSYLA
jgi:hypothetical protein